MTKKAISFSEAELSSWVYQLKVVAASLQDGGQVLLSGQIMRVLGELSEQLPQRVRESVMFFPPPAQSECCHM